MNTAVEIRFSIAVHQPEFPGTNVLISALTESQAVAFFIFDFRGKPVGDLSSAAYGHTVGASVGLGYVKRADGAAIDAAWLEQAQFEVDLAGTRLKARLSLRCPYDPAGARIKG